ncbi:MAG TPA: copper resistance protein NlpE [Flavobacteriaceae bacterium]|nr:copper resistance protein NlpE [Flavobacteriaceae bacterium]
MKKQLLIVLCIALISFVGCKDTAKKENQNEEMETEQTQNDEGKSVDFEEVPDQAHNSRNALDWSGNYHGTMPCADCPGIETTLNLNTDLTYKIKLDYLDRDTVIEEKGKFEWDNDGQRIKLHPENQDGTEMAFFVGENILYRLDEKGNRVTGDLADKYILEKY